jgi:DNA-binding MarR family transcriptional regulator
MTYTTTTVFPLPPERIIEMSIADLRGEFHLSKSQAYKLHREAQYATLAEEPEPNTKWAILTEIGLLGRAEVDELDATMRAHGASLGKHDLVHQLWALQKQQLVTFYERKRDRTLLSIRLTDKGKEAMEEFRRNGRGEPLTPEMANATMAAGPTATNDDTIVDPRPAVRPADRFPLITDLLERGTREKKARAAAELLESIGEVDLALSALERYTFTPLELEVIEMMADKET